MSRKLPYLRVGVQHSIIGKNDGVSIVIDDTIKAMIDGMRIPLGNIFFLAAHSPSRFQVRTDEIFWHKNEINKMAVRHFSGGHPADFEERIEKAVDYAKSVIAKFVEDNKIDLLLAHNTSHIYNFTTAVALGRYITERRGRGLDFPKVICWWHDSHYERERFKEPSELMGRYIKYLPGDYLDGLVFINSLQPSIAKHYLESTNPGRDWDAFLAERSAIIPNTCDITWDWRSSAWDGDAPVAPPQAQYNQSFFKDIGLLGELRKRYLDMEDAVILLQHTRVVPRKKIETSIDLAFQLERRFRRDNRGKCVVLLISGPSGDEQSAYKRQLKRYFNAATAATPKAKVMLVFGEDKILPEREIIVDRKYYRFYDIPSIVAAAGGMGTYFSEVEGYGNNLLEMIRFGLPVVVNRYDIFRRDIEKLGFKFPRVDEGKLTEEVIEECYQLLVDPRRRNQMVKHNLEVLEKRLNSSIIGKALAPIIRAAMK